MEISNTTLSLTWEPPFTLDITDIEHDITGYCVDVIAHSEVLHSECGINVTEFSYPIPPDAGCTIYLFRVTPLNIVGLGEATTLPYRSLNTGILSDQMMLYNIN